MDVPGPFGTTHVVMTGSLDAVLLHGYMATSAMWAPNIEGLRRARRVYAFDVMGQPFRSIPGEPIRSEADYVAWLTSTLDSEDDAVRPVLDLMYLGVKRFRMPYETMRVLASPFSDAELRALPMPALLLMGDREVICDRVAALARARHLIPRFEGGIVPGCRHDLCYSQNRLVDARVSEFLGARGAT